MNTQWIKNNNRLIQAICGSLIVVLPVMYTTTSRSANLTSSTVMSLAQINSPSNLLSEVPFRGTSLPITPTTSPLPELQQPPIAIVVPIQGKVDVKLVNQTNTNVTFQVIGDTKPRTLYSRSEVTLQSLRTPINITFLRPDRGLLQVQPQSIQPGILEVRLRATTDLGVDKKAMTIQRTGAVLLN